MQTTSFDFDAIGTHWRIDIPRTTQESKRKSILENIVSVIEDFDRTYSRFRQDSLISIMSKKEGQYPLPETAQKMIDLYFDLYSLTGGTFTPLIGDVLELAGYDRTYSLTPRKLKQPPSWEDALDYSFPILTIKQPVTLDFGAGGKGYLIDLVGEVLKKSDIPFFSINAGGDILYTGSNDEKLRVGLENPDMETQVIGVAEIYNQSICGSAGNRRKWRMFHHIIDPFSLSSPKEIKATWVVADTALLADCLSTCLFFIPPETLESAHLFSYAMLKKDNLIIASDDFPATFFAEKGDSTQDISH